MVDLIGSMCDKFDEDTLRSLYLCSLLNHKEEQTDTHIDTLMTKQQEQI